MSEGIFKVCSCCRKDKPLDDFHRSKRSKDGRHFYCRVCQRAKDSQPKNRFSTSRAAMRAEGSYEDLTYEQWLPLISKPCYYCDGPLPKTGRGVDRIVSEIGYTAANLVPCCGTCNGMKGKFISCDEFKRHFGPGVKALKAERIAGGLDPLTARTAPNQHDNPTRRQRRKAIRAKREKVSA